MHDLMRRLERLEQAAPPSGYSVFLVQWEGEPKRASCRGDVIERQGGESVEEFRRRAIERFRVPDAAVYVWMGL